MMSFTKRASIIGCGVLALAAAQAASAATIGFEPSEGYVPGPLVPQQGWVFNEYVGTPNGTVEVSTVSPLVGSQSLLYTQTNTGAYADVSKANVVTTPTNGTTASDLDALVRLQADENSLAPGQIGVLFGSDGFNGTGQIGVLLEGARSSTGAGNVFVVHNNKYVKTAVPYVPNNVYEFDFGVDFDNGTYTLGYRDVTAGQTTFTSMGSASFPTSGTGGFAADPGGTYTVDVIGVLRGGIGRADNIVLTPIPEPATAGLALLGLSGFALRRRRSKQGA